MYHTSKWYKKVLVNKQDELSYPKLKTKQLIINVWMSNIFIHFESILNINDIISNGWMILNWLKVLT